MEIFGLLNELNRLLWFEFRVSMHKWAHFGDVLSPIYC